MESSAENKEEMCGMCAHSVARCVEKIRFFVFTFRFICCLLSFRNHVTTALAIVALLAFIFISHLLRFYFQLVVFIV